MRKTFLRALLTKPTKYAKNFAELKKERRISKFRKKYFNLTKPYKSNAELKAEKWDDATFICGSDQIWNPYFTLYGEGQKTLSYFLDFVPSDSEKIAYAGSFGVTNLNEEMKKIVFSQLSTFKKVSVREKSAVSMLQEIGVQADLVCDPVFLPQRETWLSIAKVNMQKKKSVFSYILHDNQTEARAVSSFVKEALDADIVGNKPVEVDAWLGQLKEAEFVVTNSFHATAFSVIFHRPFVSVLLKENGMNDRLITLLKALGLEDRIMERFDETQLKEKMNAPIDWDSVCQKLNDMRVKAQEYLKRIGE